MDIKASLKGVDLLSLVPAGGMGTRLGALTAERAKPALAIGFDAQGNIQRMIDVPLTAIRQLGGSALVTTRFAAETLDFVDKYPHAQTRREEEVGSPVDSLIGERTLLEASKASTIGIIPGDAYVTAEMLEGMWKILENSTADAAILATRHLEGHNVRAVDRNGLMTTSEDATNYVADLGVHLMKREWLLEQLRQRADQGWRGDIWDLYGVYRPTVDVLLYVPRHDPVAIDMGTGTAFHTVVSRLNAGYADRSGNIAFPGATIDPLSTETIALPSSFTSIALTRVTVPEGQVVDNLSQVLRC